MKILVIGDTHGRKGWKYIVSEENPDLTIFMGGGKFRNLDFF